MSVLNFASYVCFENTFPTFNLNALRSSESKTIKVFFELILLKIKGEVTFQVKMRFELLGALKTELSVTNFHTVL